MARYRVKINTDSYKCKRCSKKNWKPGTMNDYMLAINGITRTIYTKRELIWQSELFRGQSFLLSEYDSNNPKENFGLSNRYVKFLKKNTIKYYDRLCGFERQQYLSGYGFMQGYFDIDKVLDLLKKEGSVKVPFSWLYDIRQYDKSCVKIIIKKKGICTGAFFVYKKNKIFSFLQKFLFFFNLAYYMCGAEPAGNIPAPMLQQYIYKRKKRGKTNGKEKIK